MRWVSVLVVVVVVALAGVGSTDPIRAKTLAARVRLGATAEERETAAKEIAVLVRKGQADAITDALTLVIADDAKIRAPLINALIDGGTITRATAAHVPTATVLTSQLKKLLAPKKLALVPIAKDCAVTGGTPKFATLTCFASRCAGSCRHERTSLTVTTGVRWRVDEVQQNSNEDGVCGHCI